MKHIFYLSVAVLLFSCSNETKNDANGNLLPDSLFAFHDIKSSLFVENFWYDEKDNYKMYADSTRKISFVAMDSAQKMRFIVPLLGIDPSYVVRYMSADFISKQEPIGDLQPIICWLNGDDYEALLYIVLDKDQKPVDHFVMYGGENGGPVAETDSTLELVPVIHSFLKGNEIKWYSLTEFVRTDSVTAPSIFDSIDYLSKILPSGEIETKRLDSTRFERMPKP